MQDLEACRRNIYRRYTSLEAGDTHTTAVCDIHCTKLTGDLKKMINKGYISIWQIQEFSR